MMILLQIYEPFQYASRTITVLLKYATVRGNSAPFSNSLPYPKATVTRREERSKADYATRGGIGIWNENPVFQWVCTTDNGGRRCKRFFILDIAFSPV